MVGTSCRRLRALCRIPGPHRAGHSRPRGDAAPLTRAFRHTFTISPIGASRPLRHAALNIPFSARLLLGALRPLPFDQGLSLSVGSDEENLGTGPAHAGPFRVRTDRRACAREPFSYESVHDFPNARTAQLAS